jgi:hypothetical protein
LVQLTSGANEGKGQSVTACSPCEPGRAESHGFEYKRNGTLSLFAALNTATGEVFTVTGFRDYDRVTVWDGLVQTHRAAQRETLIDEAGRLERFLLETSRGQIDEDLYRFVASVAGKQAARK